MVASYYFILQPKYETPADALHGDVPANTTIDYIANEESTYLEQQSDGSYTLFHNGIILEENISSTDVDSGLYDFYPIKHTDESFIDQCLSLFENFIS